MRSICDILSCLIGRTILDDAQPISPQIPHPKLPDNFHSVKYRLPHLSAETVGDEERVKIANCKLEQPRRC